MAGQGDDWKKQTSKNGKIEVLSNFYEEIDQEGNSYQIIEYIVSTTTNLTLDKCTKMMNNVSLHKYFYKDTEESRVLETLSDSTWIVYYYIDSSWPLPDSDTVCKMTRTEDKEGKMVQFDINAVSGMYEMKDVRRIELSKTSYIFKRISNNKINVTIRSKFAPVVNVPTWLIKTWLPDGPIEIIENIISLSVQQ
jgi:hypothetical protein